MVKLEIMPARKELLANDKVALRVHGRYSDQSEKPITRDLRWQISDPTIAAITPEGQLSGLRPGRVDVAVRAGEVTSAPVTLVVKELPKKAPVETAVAKPPTETNAVAPAARGGGQGKPRTLHRAGQKLTGAGTVCSGVGGVKESGRGRSE